MYMLLMILSYVPELAMMLLLLYLTYHCSCSYAVSMCITAHGHHAVSVLWYAYDTVVYAHLCYDIHTV